jgi:hypothetical protein
MKLMLSFYLILYFRSRRSLHRFTFDVVVRFYEWTVNRECRLLTLIHYM